MDEILEEVYRNRDQLVAECGGDLHRLGQLLDERVAAAGRVTVVRPPRRPPGWTEIALPEALVPAVRRLIAEHQAAAKAPAP